MYYKEAKSRSVIKSKTALIRESYKVENPVTKAVLIPPYKIASIINSKSALNALKTKAFRCFSGLITALKKDLSKEPK